MALLATQLVVFVISATMRKFCRYVCEAVRVCMCMCVHAWLRMHQIFHCISYDDDDSVASLAGGLMTLSRYVPVTQQSKINATLLFFLGGGVVANLFLFHRKLQLRQDRRNERI